jgi:heptosyltransferase-1
VSGGPSNILIIKPSAMGDIVLALPALRALRRSFPESRISWLVRPEFAELLWGHPDLDEIILFDRRLLGKWWYSPKAFGELMRLMKRLRRERFDIVFDFQGLFRTGFLAWATGCKKRIGMAEAREFATVFYTHKIPQDYSCVHLVDYYLRMAEAGGAQGGKAEFKLLEDEAAEGAVRGILKEYKVDFDNYVVIVPGAARANKRWPMERFAELADKIAEGSKLSVVAVGSEAERGYIDALRLSAKRPIVNIAGRTGICELTRLLRGAKLVVSNDTGPGHIAAALGVPMVMIFGPTNPARVCPYDRPECAAVVEPNERGMKADSYEPKHSIDRITVEQVFEKVCRQMIKV